ncbi:MAG: hypothetical protein QW734_03860 [Candidatus Bathyarchaeia archaeon]
MKGKKWYKSKTIWFGIIACVYGIVKTFIDGEFSTEELAAIWAGLQSIFLRLGIGNIE